VNDRIQQKTTKLAIKTDSTAEGPNTKLTTTSSKLFNSHPHHQQQQSKATEDGQEQEQ
jgi:hypothetical protein